MSVFDKRYLTGDRMLKKLTTFPIPYSYYEYDIKSAGIVSELPCIILKEKNEDDEYSVIPVVGFDALDNLERIITIYSLKGKKGLKEERER